MSFFQSVRLLEHAQAGSLRDACVGGGASADDEAVRIKVGHGAHFPENEVSGASYDQHTHQAELTVDFMGLTGPSGVLPLHYTEYTLQRFRKGDAALSGFLNLFHHRALSFFYRAWKKYRLDVNAEIDGAAGKDPISQLVAALLGMFGEAHRGRLKVRDVSLFAHTGSLARRADAKTLAWMIKDTIGEPVRVRSFVGDWITIPEPDRSRPGDDRSGAWNQLGVDAVIGAQYWDVQRKFRIELGPLPRRRLQEFLPGGTMRARIVELARFAAGPGLEFDFELSIQEKDIPPIELGGDEVRLGLNAWLPASESRRRLRYARSPVRAGVDF